MVAVWLIEEGETTLKYYYLEDDKKRVRLEPANSTMEPLYMQAENVRIEGKVVRVIPSLARRSDLSA